MPKFRKKPVVIEAFQFFNEDDQLTRAYPKWLLDALINGTIEVVDMTLKIKTLEGPIFASEGDWIIQGVQGELYPCKPDIFAQTYEAVDDANN